MRMWVVTLLVAWVTACSTPTPTPLPEPTPAPPTPACAFQMGFAEFQRQIPDVVGACTGNEQPQASGDSHQRTTNGLLVWRKADGAIGFTDGHRTWVRGPDGGIRTRLNDERFPFEPDPPGVTLRVVQPGPPISSTAESVTPGAAPTQPADQAPTPTGSAAAPQSATLTSAAIADSLRASDLPVTNVVAHTAESDPNKLLGRPNQYVAKVSWTDGRAADAIDPEGTIEVFADEAGMNARAQSVEAVTKNTPALVQYVFTDAEARAVLRVPKELTPDQARQYEEWLKTLG